MQRRKKCEKAGPLPTIRLLVVNINTTYEFLSYIVVEISLTKKCYGNMEGQTNGRREDRRTDGIKDISKPVCSPLFRSGGVINIEDMGDELHIN